MSFWYFMSLSKKKKFRDPFTINIIYTFKSMTNGGLLIDDVLRRIKYILLRQKKELHFIFFQNKMTFRIICHDDSQ